MVDNQIGTSRRPLLATPWRPDLDLRRSFRAELLCISLLVLLASVHILQCHAPVLAAGASSIHQTSASSRPLIPVRLLPVGRTRGTASPQMTPGRARAAPTPTPSPTPDVCPRDAAIVPADWPLRACDTFDDNAGEWPTGRRSDDYVITDWSIEDGVYRWQQGSLKSFFTSTRYDAEQFSDFYLAVDARMVDGPADAEWGLQLRRTDRGEVYSFTINEAGQFSFSLLQGNDWTTLVDWTSAAAIRIGEVNRLGIKAEGSRFSLYVNNRPVKRWSDERIDGGFVGLATSFDANEKATFEFDNFALYLPTGEERPAGVATPRTRAPVTNRARATPTALPSATVTPRPAAVGGCPPASVSAPETWPLEACDTFADNSSNWATSLDNGAWADITRQIEDGSYRWDVDSLKGVYASSRYQGEPLSDFFVALDGRRVSGSDKMNYGIQFRWVDSKNFYAFEVAESQQFKVATLYKNNWQTLQDWTKSEAIHPGEFNRLAVKAQGPQLAFYVNDVEVASLVDTRLERGRVGAAVDVDQGEQVSVEFDNFELRSPARVGPVATLSPQSTVAALPTGKPSPTSPRGPSRLPTATPEPTAEAATCGAGSFSAPRTWTAIVCDPFTDNSGGWLVGPDNSQYATGTRKIDGGTYQWQTQGIQGAYLSSQYGEQVFSDFHASASTLNKRGPETAYHGLQFRWADPGNFYLFAITDSQYYKVMLYYQQAWQTVIEPTASTAIRKGESNRLAVKAEGPRVTLYVNDRQVGEFVDRRLSEGKVGLVVGPEVGQESVVEFDDFEVRVPPSGHTPAAVVLTDQPTRRSSPATRRGGISAPTATPAQ